MATVCTEEFGALARDEAAGLGYPGLPIVLIPHPLGDRPKEWTKDTAHKAVEEIVHVLTSPAEVLAREYQGRYPPSRGTVRYRPKFR
ncbi:MAG: hypothetical protein HYY01_08280 [Chloroflexi bacterium]|nr:hypothetical protein [Chloroflexota bacterium]